MFNAKKILGIIVSLVGIIISRLGGGSATTSSSAFFFRIAGVLLACAGIAVFASGIQKRIIKKIRICPHCYKKNDAEQELCSFCKKPFEKTTK